MLQILGGVATNADVNLGKIPGHIHNEMMQLFNNLKARSSPKLGHIYELGSQQPKSISHFFYNVYIFNNTEGKSMVTSRFS
jgi:oligoendopeptidase F